jgi:hypothetical protein
LRAQRMVRGVKNCGKEAETPTPPTRDLLLVRGPSEYLRASYRRPLLLKEIEGVGSVVYEVKACALYVGKAK